MNLVVCFDGTWNEASTRTNVWKLKQDIDCSPGSGTQATYIEGIGTVTGDELMGGMFAADFDRPLGLAYRWLTKKILNAPDGEDVKVYLFGFSRGGYLAHTFSWLLHEVGVPRRFAACAPLATAYAKKDASEISRLARDGVLASPPVALLGLWDAVTSPHDLYRGYHDGEKSPVVAHVCHAMATDERRKLFGVMQYRPGPGIEQMWFSGVHMDVGGGYPDGECELSDVALDWMKRCARRHGLGILVAPGHRPSRPDFSALSRIHNEETPLDPIEPRAFLDGETIDGSVRDRIKMQEGYFPAIASVPSGIVDWLRGLVAQPHRDLRQRS
ncbi:MAG: DUF2235 domain-containing protein [Kiritimatiellae bacterium]|nr:DUF2235 domain-containing protein [Kiritimatiellia bacterium]